MEDRRFDIYAAVMGCRTVTADGRRAYIEGWNQDKKWGVQVRCGADKWLANVNGYPCSGKPGDRVFTVGGMKGGAE